MLRTTDQSLIVGPTRMYRIPASLDLSPVLGEFTTQLRVGQFDLQFTLGPVNFAVQSPVRLVRGGEVIARWQEAKWPDPGFFEIMNTKVSRYTIPNDRTIVLEFENGITMHLEDSSDQYESMQISIKGNPTTWII
jgi:hypothetical protein